MYDTILVPTDGSDHALRAATHGAYLADLFDASIHLLTAVDVDAASGPFSVGGVDDEFIARLKAQAESAVDATESVVANVETVRREVLTGRPSDVILDYVTSHDIDVVAMGTHGRSGLTRVLTGSVAERVLRRSPVPVLSVRATEETQVGEGYDEVLIPTDGSEAATAAVEHGVAVAQRADARVHAVSVVNLGDLATGSEMGIPPGVLDHLEESAAEAAESVAETARAAGLDAVTATPTGYPGQALLEYVTDAGVDVVAMGTHGHTGLDRVVLGSTAERLVRRSTVPVLTVSTRQRDE
ncbi:universal stress protein [Haloarcula sp. JP-L23]|uniref:universal stress protein n=1 Tax=Haloarcula sp. JP-L23 TaxID=2716717 RepID=UPI00140E99E1|nr:universal stress protein [Haloarcula sp. JP-L23]